MIKPKSPFEKDKNICRVHNKLCIYAYIHENAISDEVTWFCEDCEPNTNGVLIDIKKETEMLWDTIRVEAWNFAHDIEKMRELNK